MLRKDESALESREYLTEHSYTHITYFPTLIAMIYIYTVHILILQIIFNFPITS